MEIKQLLRELKLGSSVAEFDDDLEGYFVETETLSERVFQSVPDRK